jgi:hypothetical protein
MLAAAFTSCRADLEAKELSDIDMRAAQLLTPAERAALLQNDTPSL